MLFNPAVIDKTDISRPSAYIQTSLKIKLTN